MTSWDFTFIGTEGSINACLMDNTGSYVALTQPALGLISSWVNFSFLYRNVFPHPQIPACCPKLRPIPPDFTPFPPTRRFSCSPAWHRVPISRPSATFGDDAQMASVSVFSPQRTTALPLSPGTTAAPCSCPSPHGGCARARREALPCIIL